MKNPSKPGRTPQDKINRHVAFALNNKPANNLSSEISQRLARFLKLRKEFSLRCIAELEKLLIPQHSFGNFPLEHRIKILKILKKLYRLPATNDSWGTGMNYLAEHFKTWKYFSGADHSPISYDAEINKSMGRKQLRKNLCGHVIKSIEAELNYVL